MQDFLFYLNLGWEHIISLDALDHQLFILVLIAIHSYKDWKRILILITAFTIGHSISLALSVFDIVKISSNWVEFLIPLTIAHTSLDNIFFRKNQNHLMKMNYYLALFFGLIHGMGFANTARIMISQVQDLTIPLLGFNIGLELGQIIVVVAIMILFYLIVTKFGLPKKYWIIGISGITLVWSFYMCLERLPF